jgi:hypothetical protein
VRSERVKLIERPPDTRLVALRTPAARLDAERLLERLVAGERELVEVELFEGEFDVRLELVVRAVAGFPVLRLAAGVRPTPFFAFVEAVERAERLTVARVVDALFAVEAERVERFVDARLGAERDRDEREVDFFVALMKLILPDGSTEPGCPRNPDATR